LCTLRFDKIDARCRFEALSYEWGKPDGLRKEIKLEGQMVSVGENLWQALDCLESVLDGRRIRINALCINQEDPVEKNHQVDMIGTIYKTAIRVRVWLGGEVVGWGDVVSKGSETAMAFKWLEHMWDAERRDFHQLWKRKKAEHFEESLSRRLQRMKTDERFWEVLPVTRSTIWQSPGDMKSLPKFVLDMPDPWETFVKWMEWLTSLSIDSTVLEMLYSLLCQN
jgi:hypothetical protein